MAKAIPISRRRQKRTTVWLLGHIKSGGGKQKVHIRDLSERGALLECDVPPRVGSEIVLSYGDFELPARVAWTGNFCAGIEFATAIDLEALADQIKPMLRMSMPRDYREPMPAR